VAVGTDAGNPYTFHGPAIHTELKYMKEAGLSDREIIQCAYITSAEAVGMENEIGQVKEGFKANLLLLSDNPLSNIQNLQKIEKVILGGKVLNLEKILEEINPVDVYYEPESKLIDDFEDNNNESNLGGK